jgi:hypothetical protein
MPTNSLLPHPHTQADPAVSKSMPNAPSITPTTRYTTHPAAEAQGKLQRGAQESLQIHPPPCLTPNPTPRPTAGPEARRISNRITRWKSSKDAAPKSAPELPTSRSASRSASNEGAPGAPLATNALKNACSESSAAPWSSGDLTSAIAWGSTCSGRRRRWGGGGGGSRRNKPRVRHLLGVAGWVGQRVMIHGPAEARTLRLKRAGKEAMKGPAGAGSQWGLCARCTLRHNAALQRPPSPRHTLSDPRRPPCRTRRRPRRAVRAAR